MSKFPEPPGVDKLKIIQPLLVTYPKGTLVWRIHFASGAYSINWYDFRYFGPTSSRFDHHRKNTNGQSYTQNRGVMYLAKNGPTCLAEVFQATRVIDRNSRSPWLAGFRIQESVTLLDLTGVFVTTIGASTAINSGARPRAQRWAKQLYEAYPQIDGILYCSSMYGNADAVTLFERAGDAIPKLTEFHRALNDIALLSMLSATAKLIRYQTV